MKKVILLVGILTMAAFVPAVMAQGTKAPAPAPATPAATTAAPAVAPAPEKPAKAENAPKAEKPPKPEKFSGTVEATDEAAKTIVVKGKKDQKTFVINDKTKITKNGKEMPLTDLKKGMAVSVDYKKDGDRMVAASVQASAPKTAKSEKTEKPAEKPADKAAEKPAAKPPEAPKK